ncbi:MAG: ATP-binding protein [Melioribacteraceae bacterium]|nr:ATP-binding protein [Melioribacteraceae bacterium]
MKFIKNILIQPKNLILIFVVTALIILATAVIELNQSKNEMLELMQQQSHTLLESLLASSHNAILSHDKIEEEMKARLLNNAGMIKLLYMKKMISNSLLESIASKNNIFRINIFSRNGKKIFSSHQEIHNELEEKENPMDYLKPILEEEADTLILGIKPSRYGDEIRYAIAIASGNGGAIVLNVDAEKLLEFRRQVGFGILLKSISQNEQIEYIALQDVDGIIAASGKLDDLESIESSDFLSEGLENENYMWRIAEVDSTNVFEAIYPFEHNEELIGIFRLGLSLKPINDINEGIIRRLLILGLFLFVFGSITITLIFVRQNFNLLSKKFSAIERYSREIIDNVSDAIIVIDTKMKIKSFNNAAMQLLNNGEPTSDKLFSLFEEEKCSQLINLPSHIEEVECRVNGVNRIFLLSKSDFTDEKKEKNIILVIRDLTEIKALENQIQRKERLVEMGELASSVAHEIRNPLNTIGTITQQLGKDFEPVNNISEFKDFTKLVYKEVRRINDIIESFLKFSKPQPINPITFNSNELFDQISKQYSALLNEKKITLIITESWKGNVVWDKTQMTQVFINLIENAIDAVNNDGKISIDVKEKSSSHLEIIFSDNGKGISKEDKNKIFHLYFTTKTKGSGIGLSIVQKIVAEHNGIISVESEPNKGTSIIISIPKVFS